jgi:hypothetical protein
MGEMVHRLSNIFIELIPYQALFLKEDEASWRAEIKCRMPI